MPYQTLCDAEAGPSAAVGSRAAGWPCGIDLVGLHPEYFPDQQTANGRALAVEWGEVGVDSYRPSHPPSTGSTTPQT
jgi:hypothetical protein